jgi:predicted phosphodiesterase
MKEKGVDAVFSGHLHKNADARFKDIQMITTSAAGKPLSNDPSGIRIINVFKTGIESDYYSVDEIPQSIMFKNK